MGIKTTDKDLGAKRIRRELKKLDGSFVTIGVHEEAGSYTDSDDNPTVAQVAMWQEFGTKHIPETPFFRSAIDINKVKIKEFQESTLNKVIMGQLSVKKGLDSFGFFLQTRIQNRINTSPSWAPPLSEATKKAKQRGGGVRGTIRLIRSTLLLRSITFQSKV